MQIGEGLVDYVPQAEIWGGNTWRRVADWYGETYYMNSPSYIPLRADSGQYRVQRGDYRRGGDAAENSAPDLGFRCAMDATP